MPRPFPDTRPPADLPTHAPTPTRPATRPAMPSRPPGQTVLGRAQAPGQLQLDLFRRG